jgi:hypothetical protein
LRQLVEYSCHAVNFPHHPVDLSAAAIDPRTHAEWRAAEEGSLNWPASAGRPEKRPQQKTPAFWLDSARAGTVRHAGAIRSRKKFQGAAQRKNVTCIAEVSMYYAALRDWGRSQARIRGNFVSFVS